QSSQARQSRWYCRNRWESRSVPFFTRKPLLETVKGFLRLDSFDAGAVPVEHQLCSMPSIRMNVPSAE
ncbi:hypothetical protein HX021_11000, partial [Sphingobacterium sp. N143]|uniref:hypothetical protein n=1 Tax=Sphingobacterium sp. N143 TaxID=2746727 RepID=UPI002578ADA5